MQLLVVSRNRQNRLNVLYPNSDVCIPRNSTAQHRHSQFLTLCICERFIYSQDRSVYFRRCVCQRGCTVLYSLYTLQYNGVSS
jgi:hypothetical protein